MSENITVITKIIKEFALNSNRYEKLFQFPVSKEAIYDVIADTYLAVVEKRWGRNAQLVCDDVFRKLQNHGIIRPYVYTVDKEKLEHLARSFEICVIPLQSESPTIPLTEREQDLIKLIAEQVYKEYFLKNIL
jgi:hypothetical protein